MHENLFNEVIRITASQLAYYLTLCYKEHSGEIPSVMHVFFKKRKTQPVIFSSWPFIINNCIEDGFHWQQK